MRLRAFAASALAVLAAPAVAQLPPQRFAELRPTGGEEAALTTPQWNHGYAPLFPLRDVATAKQFYDVDKFATLRAVSLSGASDRGAVYAELVADLLWAMRLSFSSVVATGDASDGAATDPDELTGSEKEAVQRFFAGGGNAVVALSWPLVFLAPAKLEGLKLVMYAMPKVGADFPSLGSSNDEFAANADLGAEAHLLWATAQRKFTLFGEARLGWVAGTKEFAAAGMGRQRFWFGQYAAGIIFFDIIRVAVEGPMAGPSDVQDRFGDVVLTASLFGRTAPGN
ncbi:MAG TPA: hypothetical protein VFL83_14160 [Anaeromyxobacter sp.]|nr:hypothetical protein [Anaeromyxobacter sp.]